MKRKIEWPGFLFITITPFAAILAVILHLTLEGWNPDTLYLLLFFYLITGLSITTIYHRLYSHKAYETTKGVKAFFLFFATGAWENSALKWCSDHRRHHQFVDTEKDPYNIKEGFLHAHVGWVITKQNSIHKNHAKDLLNDPLIRWQHKYYIPLAILNAFILPTIIGFLIGSPIGGLAMGGLVRLVLLHHVTFLINSLCHYSGNQTYMDTNSARDCWYIAPFSYGECYHNFHHCFQNDYRNGVKWYHIDMTKWLISCLEFLGLASNLNRISYENILRARLSMDEKRVKQILGSRFDKEFSSIEKMRGHTENCMAKMENLRKELQILKEDLGNQGKEKLKELQKTIRQAHGELKMSYSQWTAYTRSLAA